MYPVYTVPAGDTLPVLFHTFSSDDPSASVTITGLAVTDIEIYKDGSVTQRASDAGYTLLDTDGIDFDGVTGIHGFSIDTSDNTDAGFYTVGAWFHVVVSAITVDAATINFIACAFRLMAAEGVAGVPDVNTTHISDTVQTAGDVGADVAAILVDTSTTIDNLVDDLESRLGTPSDLGSGATVAGNLADMAGATFSSTTDSLEALRNRGDAAWITATTVDLNADQSGVTVGTVNALGTQAKADVNAEVVDTLATDTYAEPTGVPAATASIATKLGTLHMALRNKVTVTATKKTFFDDGDAAEWEKDLSDDGTTYTETEGNAI